jgi:putative DNA primase/helicase
LANFPLSGINYPFIEERLKAINPANSPAYNTADDISSALLFKAIFGQFVRYNPTAKSWYIYDGIRWKPDPGDLTVETYAKHLSRAMLIYSADVTSKDFQKYVFQLQERRRRKTMIDDARDLLPVLQTDFDADPYLFNCQNCVLNLKDHTFIDHDPDLLLSKVANVAFDPDAGSDIFEAFMDQIMQGDQAKIKYLQTLFGYAMTGTNEREECVMLYGATTRNGKGTLTNTIKHLFGDYGANIQPETLAMQKNRDGRTASGDIARLNGVRFLQMSEPPKRMKIDVALLKTLIGRDVITARHLYEREFEFTPCFKLFINTNFLPVVLDDTLFSSGRVKVVTFDRHFDEVEQDHTLKDRLQTPEALSGILNWILKGLKQYHANGNTISIPDSVQTATDEYRSKSDKMKTFIEEVLTPDDRAVVKAKEVYIAFGNWCKVNGYGVENKSNFLTELRAKGLLSDTGTINGRTYHNVVKGYTIDDELIGTGDD